jgi:lipopolysaccharide biosynthesis glycosyltransferase
MQRYASRVGADFRVMTRFPDQARFGPPCWGSVRIIKDFAVQSRWDQLLLLDLDVLVTPHCEDLFALASDRIAVVPDMGIPHVDPPFRDWCRRYYHEEPAAGNYFNAGMLVIPRAAALRLLNCLHAPYPNDVLPDNHYLNLKLVKREPIQWLPVRYNWLAPQVVKDPLEFGMIHFVGGTKALLPDLAMRLEQ